jgi:hypothetical protein
VVISFSRALRGVMAAIMGVCVDEGRASQIAELA